MKTNTKKKPKCDPRYQFEEDVGTYDGLYFGHVEEIWDKKGSFFITSVEKCKESFLEDDTQEKVVIAFKGAKFGHSLAALHSFEKEFGIPLTTVDEVGKDYAVLNVNKKWQTNLVTYGLFLELARYSHIKGAKSWKGIQTLKCRNVEKIKLLWSKEFDALMNETNYNITLETNNCVYWLDEFNFSEQENAFENLYFLLGTSGPPLYKCLMTLIHG